MKKYLSIIFVTTVLIFSIGRIPAQSDKNIFKSAEERLKEKDCKAAFDLIITAKHVDGQTAQDLLKRAYPCMISANTKAISAVKLTDTSNYQLMSENLRTIIQYLKDNQDADSLLKIYTSETLYKTLSKDKRNSKLLASYETRLKAIETKLNTGQVSKVQSPNTENKQTESVKTVETNNTDDTENIKQTAINNSTQVSDQNNSPEETKEPITTDDTMTGSYKYYIIQGSYQTIIEAAKIIKNLKAQGYAAEMAGQNSSGNYRVSYSNYSTETEALKALEEIRKFQNKAWILEKQK